MLLCNLSKIIGLIVWIMRLLINYMWPVCIFCQYLFSGYFLQTACLETLMKNKTHILTWHLKSGLWFKNTIMTIKLFMDFQESTSLLLEIHCKIWISARQWKCSAINVTLPYIFKWDLLSCDFSWNLCTIWVHIAKAASLQLQKCTILSSASAFM